MNKKVLTLIGLVALVAILASGAFAYFTADRTSTSTVSTGTLDILIAASPDVYTVPADWEFGETANPWVFDKLVPGESKSGCLWLMNTGDVGTVQARYDFTVVGTTGGTGTGLNLADRLELTSVITSDSLFNWIPTMWLDPQWDPNLDGKITLQELANYGGDWKNDNDPFVPVAPGGKGAICMTFEMINGTPAEDNPYQGTTLTYTAKVTAFNPAP